MKERELRIIIAGGGTGGHLFPGIAIARELKKRCEKAHILFIVGRRKMERDIILKAGFEIRSIDVEGMLGKDLLSIPGITNRILAPLAKKVFISFEESMMYFKKGKLFLSGNPIRDELLNPEIFPRRVSNSVDGTINKRFVILVMGGSQGARAINNAVLSALKELEKGGSLPFVIHQTGDQDLKEIIADYHTLGIDGEVTAFIEDMASAYARADLVICRAGATTIAELAALGKPSILVPYPYATHKHQNVNARALAAHGGADIVLERDLNGNTLAKKIRMYMEKPDVLTQMSLFALKAGRPQARQIIVDQLMELIN
jgi:UDP-N-acetylglucosamine--N-acetylmuramyl-(pentapeptide) pyrophosphoryl-undecaprenol N-acetylglucosamine transferase